MVNHGNLVKIMANHDTWNACQVHGKIMTRSWQDNHGKTCELYNRVIHSFHENYLSSPVSE